jgi:hypothetical protein
MHAGEKQIRAVSHMCMRTGCRDFSGEECPTTSVAHEWKKSPKLLKSYTLILSGSTVIRGVVGRRGVSPPHKQYLDKG